MFNFARDDGYEREFFYFRLSGHIFCVSNDIYRFRHDSRDWFPHNSKEVDFDKNRSSKFWFGMSV